MWWKIYFWVVLVLTALAFFDFVTNLSSFTLVDIRGMVESLLVVLGTYQYVMKKHVLDKSYWNIIFFYLVIAWLLDLLYTSSLKETLAPVNFLFESSRSSGMGVILFSMLLGLPGLFAIYQLAQQKKKK